MGSQVATVESNLACGNRWDAYYIGRVVDRAEDLKCATFCLTDALIVIKSSEFTAIFSAQRSYLFLTWGMFQHHWWWLAGVFWCRCVQLIITIFENRAICNASFLTGTLLYLAKGPIHASLAVFIGIQIWISTHIGLSQLPASVRWVDIHQGRWAHT